eukprot:TRINITY_DN13326_c0_g1_i2.p1 TRINITY_DN13326_c0_g1~~TRINITY_DN13326_c0_g1_i2.p1  ORF type:complete len:487 (+),score=151.20 TRINITY_DN13326_c0_g1_i2:104-1564(+)
MALTRLIALLFLITTIRTAVADDAAATGSNLRGDALAATMPPIPEAAGTSAAFRDMQFQNDPPPAAPPKELPPMPEAASASATFRDMQVQNGPPSPSAVAPSPEAVPSPSPDPEAAIPPSNIHSIYSVLAATPATPAPPLPMPEAAGVNAALSNIQVQNGPSPSPDPEAAIPPSNIHGIYSVLAATPATPAPPPPMPEAAGVNAALSNIQVQNGPSPSPDPEAAIPPSNIHGIYSVLAATPATPAPPPPMPEAAGVNAALSNIQVQNGPSPSPDPEAAIPPSNIHGIYSVTFRDMQVQSGTSLPLAATPATPAPPPPMPEAAGVNAALSNIQVQNGPSPPPAAPPPSPPPTAPPPPMPEAAPSPSPHPEAAQPPTNIHGIYSVTFSDMQVQNGPSPPPPHPEAAQPPTNIRGAPFSVALPDMQVQNSPSPLPAAPPAALPPMPEAAGANAAEDGDDLPTGSGSDGEPAPLPTDEAGAPWSHVGGFR